MELEHIKKELGLRIKNYRKHRRQTQESFSELIELEQPSLSNIENGKTYPTLTTICNLINKAGMEPNYLFDFLCNKSKDIKYVDYEILGLLNHMTPKTKELIKEIIRAMNKE